MTDPCPRRRMTDEEDRADLARRHRARLLRIAANDAYAGNTLQAEVNAWRSWEAMVELGLIGERKAVIDENSSDHGGFDLKRLVLGQRRC